MQQNSGFSMAEAAKLLASAEGNSFWRCCAGMGGDALSQAAAAMRAGDAEGAKPYCSPFWVRRKRRPLLEQLNRRR